MNYVLQVSTLEHTQTFSTPLSGANWNMTSQSNAWKVQFLVFDAKESADLVFDKLSKTNSKNPPLNGIQEKNISVAKLY